MKKSKDESITFRVTKEQKELLGKLADEERRSLSQFITLIIDDWLKQKNKETKTTKIKKGA